MPRHTPTPAVRRIASALAVLALAGLGISLGGSASADPIYSITGTITDTTGAPIASLPLVLDDSTNTPVDTATTGSDGTYTFASHDSGSYTVVTSTATGYVAVHGAVTVASGDAVLNLVDPLNGSLSGTVTGGGGPLTGVRIAAFDSVSDREFDADGPTDGSGAYSITLPATNSGYTFYFVNSGGGRLAVQSYNFGGGAVAGSGCRLISGASSVAPLAAGTPLTLTVVLNPDPAACVAASPTPAAQAGTPTHHSTTLAKTGSAPTATEAPAPTESAAPQMADSSATTSLTPPTVVKPTLTPTSSTGAMPAWGWLLVVAAVLAMLGGVSFTVVRHR